jgi:hypothetical protein
MILCRKTVPKSRRALFKSRDCARRFSIMARIALRTALLASTFAAFLAPSPLLAQHEHGVHAPPAGAQIGEVHFPTSCSPDSQHRFNQAVWTLHSFWYEESLKQFTAIAEAEPSCAMAYWGMAMSQWYPLWFPPSPAMLKSGAAAVAKGLAVPPATERERAYLEAIGRFYQNSDTLDHRTRAVAYAQAMDELHTKYPDDREAAVFYALALDATWPPTDNTYANLKKAAGILETVWAEQPNHPGVVHYLIHSYDVPALAPQGLKAARVYAAIAPAVPHAQHMPSHIFTRLVLLQENRSSPIWSAIARRKPMRRRLTGRAATTRKPCTRSTISRTPICKRRRMGRQEASSMRSPLCAAARNPPSPSPMHLPPFRRAMCSSGATGRRPPR